MGVRGMEQYLVDGRSKPSKLHRRMILAPAPRERERWHPIWLAAGGWAAFVMANGLDPHPIGRWVPAFGEGGPAVLIFEQTGGPPRHWSSAARRTEGGCTGEGRQLAVRGWPTGEKGSGALAGRCCNQRPSHSCETLRPIPGVREMNTHLGFGLRMGL